MLVTAGVVWGDCVATDARMAAGRPTCSSLHAMHVLAAVNTWWTLLWHLRAAACCLVVIGAAAVRTHTATCCCALVPVGHGTAARECAALAGLTDF